MFHAVEFERRNEKEVVRSQLLLMLLDSDDLIFE